VKSRSTILNSKTLKSLAAPTLDIWRDELVEARWFDRTYGTSSMVRNTRVGHLRRGFKLLVIYRDDCRGWTVTDHDGGKVLLRGVSRDAAVSFAACWHGKDPDRREVAIARNDAQALHPSQKICPQHALIDSFQMSKIEAIPSVALA
jgi:hypothetical protein